MHHTSSRRAAERASRHRAWGWVVVWALVVLGASRGAHADPRAAERSHARIQRRLDEAAAVGRALARVQNDWGARVLLTVPAPGCGDPVAGDRAARARVFGADWHRRLLAVEEELERARVHHGDAGTELHRSQLAAQQEAYLAAVAWQATRVEPWARRCVLRVLPGTGPAEPGGALHEPPLTAVIALSGMLCPGMLPGSGGVLVVDGPICAAPLDDCSCQPHPVLPGSALEPRR
jgi:hypothetical protein